MMKVLLGVYFGGLVISAIVAYRSDPSGTVGPWLVIAWAIIWGPVTTAGVALLFWLLRATAKPENESE